MSRNRLKEITVEIYPLRRGGGSRLTVATDDDGRFALSDVAPGVS
jgi:hypothetical protein